MRNTLTLLLALVLLSACGGDPAGLAKVKAILVTPGVVTLSQAGATQQFTAQAVDESGTSVPGVAVTWRSSNVAIVRVDAATGIATAVAEGSATVIAESSGASGSASVSVDIPECIQPTSVNLAVGQTLVTDIPTSATCAVRFPAGVARYRVAIVRLSTAQDSTAPNAILTLTPRGAVTTGAVPAPPAPQPPLLDAAQADLLRASARIADATARVHENLRAAEDDLLRRLGPFAGPVPFALVPSGPRPTAPAKKTFLPRTSTDGSCAIGTKTSVTAVLVAESPSMVVYQDSAQAQSQPVSVANVQRMLDFFTSFGKSTIESYFGAIPDRDGNGQVIVFLTPQVGGNVAAFVWGGDQLNATACSASNQAELVYFNTFLINQMSGGNYQALETLVHEVKHVVSFNHRLSGTTFVSQPTWLEEGTAEIAGEIATRKAWAKAGGPAVNELVTRSSFPAMGSKVNADNYGVYLRLQRTKDYLTTQPNAVVYGPASSAYTIYGSGWHFSRFLGDGYGGAASSPGGDAGLFLNQNAASTPAGLLGLETVTGTTFNTLLVGYAAATMLNGTGAPVPTHGFTTYDFPSVLSILPGTTVPYPYPVTAGGTSNPSVSFAGGTWSGLIGNAGLRIHDFVSNGSGNGADITVQVEEPAKLVVVRLQ